MRVKNWVAVPSLTNGGSSLPIGAYVAKIIEVKDDEDRECLEITWDVAEGEHAGHYNDEWGKQNKWAHTFNRFYGDVSESSFKLFLEAVESSNPGKFSIAYFSSEAGACNPNMLVGMLVGVNLRKRLYVSKKGANVGKTQEAIEVGEVLPASTVRSGNAKELPPKDTRTEAEKAAALNPAAPQAYQQPAPQQSMFARPSNLTAQEIAYAQTVQVPFSS